MGSNINRKREISMTTPFQFSRNINSYKGANSSSKPSKREKRKQKKIGVLFKIPEFKDTKVIIVCSKNTTIY
ncbi:hypothetical protein Ahy_B08g094250 isoform C [Arachis hypogaea]|uniref:Uncharacterized protein n=1 Tax=Arachis hypogaea TaxID=3818 RepID=A0A444Y8A7_ARAHY|nr:hypothetical protein Ahy_B08g094250 isoform C [Arachis hypogaea]